MSRGVDAIKAQLIPTLEREVLEALQVIVQSPSTFENEHPPSVSQPARRKLRGSRTNGPSLSDKHFCCVVATEIGGSQLHADLVRAAGENENVASNISDEGLSTDPILTAYELDRQRDARHDCTVAPGPEPSLRFDLARRTANAAPLMLNGGSVATGWARRRNSPSPPRTPGKMLTQRQTGTAQATGGWPCQ